MKTTSIAKIYKKYHISSLTIRKLINHGYLEEGSDFIFNPGLHHHRIKINISSVPKLLELVKTQCRSSYRRNL